MTSVAGRERRSTRQIVFQNLIQAALSLSAGRGIMDAILILQQKRLLRVDEAARVLNVSRWTVYRWVEEGRLGGTRLGAGSLRIFSETVAALIDHHCIGVPVTAIVRQGNQSLDKTSGPTGRQDSNRGGVRPRQQAAL